MLYLWTINGSLVASINTLNVPSPVSVVSCQNTCQILCLAFSAYNEWDSSNVILTGSSDGVVKLWTVQYTQELIELENKCDPSSSDSSLSEDIKNSASLNPSADEIVRRLSLHNETQNNEDEDPNEESSEENTPVKSASDTDWAMLSAENQDNFAMAHSRSFNNNNSTTAETLAKECLKESPPVQEKVNCLTVPTIRSSKSDTSLVDSFIVVNEHRKSGTESILKSGYRWVAKLIFASKLTMHTAYERKDNKEPAAITCLAISKDHRTVFVGDARGRIFSWSVNENKSLSDHWIKDDVATNCSTCSAKFSITERKHHCRCCGNVFCAK